MSQQQPFQGSGALVSAGKLDQLALDFFPNRQRIQQQAAVAINGQHQLAAAASSTGWRYLSRDRQPPLPSSDND
jgi:hypothetical protein